MDTKDVATWVRALRSGTYQQGEKRLLIARDMEPGQWCCWGVACDVLVEGEWRTDDDSIPTEWRFIIDGHTSSQPGESVSMPSLDLLRRRGVSEGAANVLANMNDERVPFDEIADAIERLHKADLLGSNDVVRINAVASTPTMSPRTRKRVTAPDES